MYLPNKEIYNMYGWRVQYVREQKELAKKNKLNIYKSVLMRLDEDGYKLEQKGSKYLAKLAECLYFERELLKEYHDRPSFQGYWNLKDIFNPHYYELGKAERIQSELRRSMDNSYYDKDADLNEVAYYLADREILERHYLYQDDIEHFAKNAISYQKILLNK